MRRNKIAEILVVDDNLEAARSFAEYITTRLKICAKYESNLSKVLEIVRLGTIKVIILDQRMPDMSGTELYKKIHEINPYIKAIMLTGEADRGEVAEALSMGYVGYLEKNDVQSLPEQALIAYTKYQTELCSRLDEDNAIPIKIWNPLKNRMFLTKYEICSLQEMEQEYIFEDKWKTTLELEAAEKEVDDIYDFSTEIILQEDARVNSSLNSVLSLKYVSSFKAEINNAITHYLGETHKWSLRKSKRVKTIYRLQDGVEEGKRAIKKVYERNPVYIQYYILIRKICRICGKVQLVPLYLYKPVAKEKTRVRIYFSDGHNIYIDTDTVSICNL